MRSLTATLLAEQKKPTRRPVIKLEVQAYGHPSQSASIQWQLFGWERLYDGTENRDLHGCCISGDGSLHRLRLDGTTLYYSRVASPGPASDYSSWTSWGAAIAGAHIAIAANGAAVMAVGCDATYTYRRESSDNGANWGSWTQMANTRPCERGAAVAFKSNGDCIIVHASDVNDPTSLYLQKRTSGSWSTGLGQRSGDFAIEWLSAYYDGDWNIVALVIEGSYLVAYRMVYGDGYRQAAGTWATDQKMGLARARLDYDTQIDLRQFRSQRQFGALSRHTPTYWEKHQAVLQELAAESLDLAGVSLVKPSGYPAFLCMSRTNTPWLFRLNAGTDFYDCLWGKATTISGSVAPYGLAVACDSPYIWATQADEVWRSALPGTWTAPTPGSGAGALITIPQARILRVAETIEPLRESELVVELDNSKGTYDSPGSGDLTVLKRGSRVNLHVGYKTSVGEDIEEVGQYFIESYEHNRAPNRATFALTCIDAWGLLERYGFNKPVEWNMAADDYTVYALIDLVLDSIDATLDYKSRSALITTLYPRFEVHAGESAASVLRRLLALVEDVIYFFGLAAYIVYPQASDTPTYYFKGQLP